MIKGIGMKKFVYCIGVCIALFLTGCSREENAVYRDNSIDNQPQSSVQESYMFSETEDYSEESETEEIPECDVNDRSLKQVDSGKLCLLHDSEWYPYEDILFEGDYEKARSHDFMDSRGQGFHMWVYRELSDMLYDYSQRINDNLLTDGWTVERIIPIGDDCYNVLMYQEASGSRVALLFNSSEMEYKILYLHDINQSFSETHYMSQFDWVSFDREEKATAADRIDNPFEDIHEAEESHCLNVVVATYERENGYTGHWKVQEFYGDVPCFSGLLVSDDRMVWFCMNVGLHEYIAETFYYVNEEH